MWLDLRLIPWNTAAWVIKNLRLNSPGTQDKTKILLFSYNKVAIKWLLVILCYTHRSRPFSGIIRETSSCSQWDQIQRTIANHYGERGEVQIGGFHLIPSLRTQEIPWKKRLKDSNGLEDTRGAMSSKSTKQDTYELTEIRAASTRLIWVCVKSSTYIL